LSSVRLIAAAEIFRSKNWENYISID